MNKTLLAATFATLCGAAAFALPGAAVAATTSHDAGQAIQAAASQDSAHANPSSKAAKRAEATLARQNCLRATGTHITQRTGDCLPVNGRSYSRQEIQSTGMTNLGRALQQLDPSVTVSGGW